MKNELPRILRKYADKISTISDERGYGDGYWVLLKDGWCCDPATHTIHEDTPSQCAAILADVTTCDCRECKK